MAMRPALGPDTSAPRATPDGARPPSSPLHPVEALAVRKGEASAVPMVSEAGDEALGSTAFFARPGDTSEDLVRIHRLQTSGRVDPRVLMLGAPDDPAAAAFRVLRHRLRERRGARVLLVTSPRAGEGKTSTAVNLALALGEEGGARVLLIEANFRRPTLAGVLGFQPPVCLGQQFELHRGRPTAPWVVVETVPSWLHTATVAPDAASRGVLDGRALALFIEDMREAGYEYIVVDGPAILDGADANLIEERVDGILLTVRARRSRARTFRTAVDQIGAGKLLGVVVLGT
jgi:Mrp family chromosome partitioning ATPase